ncbi:MAG TPA: thermonuclease family protein [Kofleriaceae bacterium]|jgi:endonuclease YncB( thermonuclease family)|nr:thermonuclease family protein [Kofleriaceae bacterium]
MLRIVIALVFISCGTPHNARYSRQQAQHTLQSLSQPGVLVGEFTLTKVTDGDTVRVDGLDSSLRLLGIDTEEIFHHEKERRALESAPTFADYVKAQRGDSKRPVKMSTPMGEQAWKWAEQYFTIGAKVRVERDDPKQIRDAYDRYLAYVFVQKDGKWVNYNVEAVRAGMAPYFTKYGYSRRFDAEFKAAEAEAKAAHRGIWSDQTMHYPDYDEREKWWNARGDFVRQFEQDAAGKDDFIDLTDWDALDRVEAHKGKPVTVLGTVGSVYLGDKGPTRVMLSRRRGSDFPIIFFDKDLFAASKLADWKGEFVRVRGTITEYTNKHNGKTQLQIVVDRPSQIELSPVPEPEAQP